MQKPQPNTFWRHYKSSGGEDYTYEVVEVAFHSETQEEMVVYKMLYDAYEEEGKTLRNKGTLFVRPLSMWYDLVEWQGKTLQRFTEET